MGRADDAEAVMARRWRLYHAELPRDAGTTIDLDTDESHHARRVLRLAPGEIVSVFDGLGREWTAQLLRCDGGGVRLRLDQPVTEPAADPPLEVVLFQALCRPDRMDLVVQKGTEVGLEVLHPWRSERAETGRITPNRLRRLTRIAVEACKQSGRRRVPRIEPRDGPPPAPPMGVLALALDPGSGCARLREHLEAAPPSSVWIAVGPEAGFTPSEVERLAGLGWRRAGLGPRTLRTESAGLIAATLVLHRWADLG